MLEVKFMQSLEKEKARILKRIADEKGIPLQELIRAVILPEWLIIHEWREANGNR